MTGDAEELLERMGQEFGGNAGPRVRDGDRDPIALRPGRQRDLPAALGVRDGVVQEIPQRVAELVGIGRDGVRPGGEP